MVLYRITLKPREFKHFAHHNRNITATFRDIPPMSTCKWLDVWQLHLNIMLP